MAETVLAGRAQFAFTIMFHYLFPILSMGLAPLIAILKTMELVRKDDRYGKAARFWARIFAINFAIGVVTGIPMEFQFGTNWAHFSDRAGGVIGQPLAMEGIFAFFLESGFLGILLLGEGRVSPVIHWLSSLLMAFGTLLSGFFICATDAWMQHPVGYQIEPDGRFMLNSIGDVLGNPYLVWQYTHTINAALLTGCMIMAGIGAYYLLSRQYEDFGRMFVKLGVLLGLLFSLLQLFPTGNRNAEQVARYQPVKTAAMEGLFRTQEGAPMAIIGMPDTAKGRLLDPILVPDALSFLIYGNPRATVHGLDGVPARNRPPVEVVYYCYHIMVGLGTLFIGTLVLGGLLWWRGWLFSSRWYLWMLMLAMPFPYIANEAGWTVAEAGRQPWLVYGLMRTAQGVSPNVSAGETIFTTLGFMGLYTVLAILFLALVGRQIALGPEVSGHVAYALDPAPDAEETHP